MAARAFNIDNYKLDTKFRGGNVTHTAGIGQRRVKGVVGTWKQTKRIGEGGFASVWLQEEAVTGTKRAVKKILREKTREKDLLQELRSLAEVKHFKRLFIQFFGWYEDSDFFFIAMEYVEHGDLGRYLASSGPKPEAEAKAITRQLLEGLTFLHGRDICHRDLKPQNVLITSILPIRIKLADFGVSKCVKGTSLRTRLGTLAYQAPELLDILPRKLRPNNKTTYTNAIDLWSLGCLVQYILTLETPFLEGAPNTNYSDIDDSGIDDFGIGSLSIGNSYGSRSGVAPASALQMDLKLFLKFCSGDVDLPTAGLQKFCVSKKGIEFVKKLLVADPRSRISAADALEHKWFIEFSDDRQLPQTGFENRPFKSLPDFSDLCLGAIPVFSRVNYKPPSHPPRLQGSPQNLGMQLIKAAGLGDLETVKNLLAHKADITKRDELGQTPLMKATLHGSTELVEFLLEEGADMSVVDNDGHSVLHCAALNGHGDVLQLLLERGADLGVVDNSQSSGIHHAASNGHEEVVELLLGEGVDLSVVDKHGRPPLHLAAFGGHDGVMNLLLDWGADLCAVDIQAGSVLHYATLGGHIRTVELLIAEGADLGAVDNTGASILHTTALGGNKEVLKLLLDKGADLSVVANDGQSVLYAAALGGNEEIVKILLDEGADSGVVANDGQSVLHAAALGGNEVIVRLLLERGVYSSTINKNGASVLEAATYGGNKRIVEMFLGEKAGFSRGCGGVSTAMSFAISLGYEEIVRLFMQRGVGFTGKISSDKILSIVRYAAFQGLERVLELFLDLHEEGICRYSALHYAALRGYGGIVKRLLRRGVDLNAVDQHGTSALHYAALQGHERIAELVRPSIPGELDKYPVLRPAHLGCHEEIVELLLDRGADLSVVDNTGISVLHCAALIGDERIVRLLLERGADLSVVNNRKISALHYAALQGHVEIVKLFLERGADLNAVDEVNGSVIHYAAIQGHEEVVELLLERGANTKVPYSALYSAALNGHPKFIQDFLHQLGLDNFRYPVLRPTHFGGHLVVVKLLERAPGLEKPIGGELSALHYATFGDSIGIVKALLAGGADLSMTDKSGVSILHLAAAASSIEIVKFLLDVGAELSVVDNKGISVLHYAAFGGNQETAKLFLENGADLSLVDDKGRTALHYAALCGYDGVVELFLEWGAGLEELDKYGRSALHYAALSGDTLSKEEFMERFEFSFLVPLTPTSLNSYEKALKLLLNSGANLNAVDNTGSSALHFAALGGNEGVVKLLLDRQADPRLVDLWGKSPQNLSIARGHTKIANLLREKTSPNGNVATSHMARTYSRAELAGSMFGHFEPRLSNGGRPSMLPGNPILRTGQRIMPRFSDA